MGEPAGTQNLPAHKRLETLRLAAETTRTHGFHCVCAGVSNDTPPPTHPFLFTITKSAVEPDLAYSEPEHHPWTRQPPGPYPNRTGTIPPAPNARKAVTTGLWQETGVRAGLVTLGEAHHLITDAGRGTLFRRRDSDP